MNPFSKPSHISSQVSFNLKLISVVVVAFILQAKSINTFPLGFDEGVHLLVARFVNMGFRPYTETFVSQLPLFVAILSLVWSVTASNIFFIKVIFIGLNTFSLIALGYIGFQLLGEQEALLAVLLLVLSPSYVMASSAILADMMSVTMASVAILLTLIYTENSRRKWLLGAGLFLAGGLLVKLLVVHAIVLILILLSLRHSSAFRWDPARIDARSSWPDLALDLVLLSVGFVALSVAISLGVDLRAVYESTVRFRLTLREAIPFNLRDNLRELLQFWGDNSFISFGMLLALYFARDKPKHPIWFIFVWWLIGVFWLMAQIPLRSQHLAILWIPMALMAGWGLLRGCTWLAEEMRTRWQTAASVGIGKGFVLSVLLVCYVLLGLNQMPDLLNRARQIYDEDDLRRFLARPVAAGFLQNITSPEDCVLSDDPVLSLEAGRFPPPLLSEPSSARISSGDLSAALIQRVAVANDCKAFVSSSRKFRTIPDLWPWVEEHYPRYVDFEEIEIYYHEP